MAALTAIPQELPNRWPSSFAFAAQRAYPIEIDLVDIGEFHIDELERYDLLFGIPTWDHGQLQRDWERQSTTLLRST